MRADTGVDGLFLLRDAFLIGNGIDTRVVGLGARCTREATEPVIDGARTGVEHDGDGGALGFPYPCAAASAPFRRDGEWCEYNDGWRYE